jgi:uncharacterized protein
MMVALERSTVLMGTLRQSLIHPAAPEAAQARRGLLVFGLLLLPLSLFGYWFFHVTRDSAPLNLSTVPIMWAPAVSALLARLLLHEAVVDSSFRLHGRRGLRAIALTLTLPLLVGTLAYGAAAQSGLVELTPPTFPGLSAETSELARVAVIVGLAATLGTLVLVPTAAGEEIGWRGYVVPRLVQAGAPRPVLVSGLLWGIWHLVPLFVSGYGVGPLPLLSAVNLMLGTVALGAVLAWTRLGTGSIWPAVVGHAAWNATINGGFDLVVSGEAARLWTGETGVLVMVILVVATFLIGVLRHTGPPQSNGPPC